MHSRAVALTAVGVLASAITTATLVAFQSPAITNPRANDPAAIAAGERVFTRACQGCHGPGGQGDSGPALNTGAFARGGQDADLVRAIREGVPGTQMPPFRESSDDQLRQLVAYIRSLKSDPVADAAARAARDAQQMVVATGDGREIRGVRLSEDTFSAHIMDGSGQIHAFDKLTRTATLLPARGVSFDRLVNANLEPHNWLMYWGDFQGSHYSSLAQIDTNNVQRLQAAWAFPMLGDAQLEATPLVIDGVMYTSQPGVTVALDARTGRQLWRAVRPQKVKNPHEINPFSRGVAVLDHRLFVGTLDAALLALDVRTGLPLWEVQVADSMLGYTITSPPLVVKDKVIVGVSGGEFGARGFLDAYEAATGKRLWRWYGVPGPGELGHNTWPGDSWKQGGGPMWLTGSYDAALNLVYWTVGNPGPQIDRSVRGNLDNLFSDSVVALDADTGRRKWHYQFTPNDGHDWDSCQAVVLVDRMWRGQMRKLLLHADRNGYFYVLDRATGQFLSGTPFVYTNWAKGFDAAGRPAVVPGSNSSPQGSFFVYPTVGGATNFQAPSYSPLTGWFYLEYAEGGQRYVSSPEAFEAGKQYIGRAAASESAVGPKPTEPGRSAGIKAIDPETGKTVWDVKVSQRSLANGVLATGGQLLFAAIRDGNLAAFDARSGQHLWHFQTGANMAASPISYAIGGRQFVAISAGNTLYAFALPE